MPSLGQKLFFLQSIFTIESWCIFNRQSSEMATEKKDVFSMMRQAQKKAQAAQQATTASQQSQFVLTESLPWVEKYRPQTLDGLLAHTDIVNTIQQLVDANRLPHLLLYGPPGTGKTSTILAIARQMHGARYQGMTLELNASDDRGINVVRDQIRDFASSRQLFASSAGVKLCILDEADALTRPAQFALRRSSFVLDLQVLL